MSAAWLIGAFASALGIGVGGGLAWIMKGVSTWFCFYLFPMRGTNNGTFIS